MPSEARLERDCKGLTGKKVFKATWNSKTGFDGIIFSDGSHIILFIKKDGKIDFILDEGRE